MSTLCFLFVLELCDVLVAALKTKNFVVLQLDKFIPELLTFQRNSDTSTCTLVYFKFTESNTILDAAFQNYGSAPRLLSTNPENLQESIPPAIKFGSHCSIVLYPSGLIQQEKILETDTNWQLRIPGGAFQSYHFSEERQVLRESYWGSPFVRRLCNFLVFSQGSQPEEWNAFVPNRFQGLPRYFKVGTIFKNEIKLFTEYTQRKDGIFWNKWRDVQGQRLTVAVPSTQSTRNLRLFLDKGIYIYAIVEVAEPVRFLNGTITDVVPNDINVGFGSKLPNGSWDSYVGKVMTDEVVFTAPFFPHQSHYPYIYFPNAVMYSSVRFLSPLPAKTMVNISFLTDPLDRFIWSALFMGAIVNAVMIYFLTIIIPSYMGNLQLTQRSRSLCRHFLQVFTNTTRLTWVLIDQPIPDSFINTEWAKPGVYWVYLGWLLLVIVIAPLYKSIMISELVEPVYTQPPRTFEQLVHSDFKLNVVLYKTVIAHNLPWTKNLKHPVTDYKLDIRGVSKILYFPFYSVLFIMIPANLNITELNCF